MPRKLALIIGNNNYQNRPLQNCINDAISLADVLRNVNCEVALQTNLKSDDMYECIKIFIETIQRDDFVIFFFAGHAVQWGDQNFLLPCDSGRITTGPDMQRYATNAQQSLDQMTSMKPHFILFLLDCCREYWLPKSTRSIAGNSISNDNQIGGLTKMIARPGTLIAFACAPGQTAVDRSSETTNGIFTKYLVKHIITPGIDIELILRRVATDVANDTNHSQIPYRVSSIMTENICLVPLVDKPPSSSKSKHKTVSSSINRTLNILLIGEKGAGKSTFINAFVNYLSFETMQQAQADQLVVLKPFSFSAFNPDTSEQQVCTFGDIDHRDPTMTSTCQAYAFDPHLNDKKTLCFIDTPSLGDTPQFGQNNTDTITHILDYVNQLSHLNVICFLINSHISEVNILFQTCYIQLLNLLGSEIRQNIIFGFTNTPSIRYSRGYPGILFRAMLQSIPLDNIPFNAENTFCFENESFRYLVASQNRIQYNEEWKDNCEMGWKRYVSESNRLLDYIRQRPVYRILRK